MTELTEADWARIADMFRAASDPQRLRLLLTLCERSSTVARLARSVGRPPTLVSQQLRVLRRACLVTTEREGRFVTYAIADEHVREMVRATIDHVLE